MLNTIGKRPIFWAWPISMATTDIVVWLIVQAYPVSSRHFLVFTRWIFAIFVVKMLSFEKSQLAKLWEILYVSFARIVNVRFRRLMQRCVYKNYSYFIMTEEHKNPTNVPILKNFTEWNAHNKRLKMPQNLPFSSRYQNKNSSSYGVSCACSWFLLRGRAWTARG